MKPLPLSRIFIEGRPAGRVVAYSGGKAKTFANFRADVAFNAERIASRNCRRGLLATADAYWGAVGLFALVAARAAVVMPQNVLPGAIAALDEQWDLLVADAPAQAGCAALQLGAATEDAHPPLGALDLAAPVTFTSSGSTGAPKRVVKSFEHLEREAEAIERLLGAVAARDALLISMVPHQHAYGLAFRLLWGLSSGRPFAAAACIDWRPAMARLEPGAVLIASPAYLGRMAGIDPPPPDRRPSLVLSAGAPLPEAAAREANALLGVPVTEIFGSTETGAIASRLRDGCAAGWRALPGVTVERTGEGLLLARGPHIPCAKAQAGQTLADCVVFDSDGGFHLLGRSDRVVKIEANRVNLAEVERALIGLDEILEAAVTALHGPPQRLAAALVLTQPGAVLRQEMGAFRFGQHLRAQLAQRFPPAALPKRWRFLDKLPVNAMGKRAMQDIVHLFSTPVPAPAETIQVDPQVKDLREIAGGIEIDFMVPDDLFYLRGHFPEQPILPGVVQIDWAVLLANRHLGLELGLEAATGFQVKFRKILSPEQMITLRLRRISSGKRLAFDYATRGEIATSGSIALTAPDASP